MQKRIKEQLNDISNTEENRDKLYSLFHSFDESSLPLVSIYISPIAFVIRQRLNEVGKEFSSITDLSYPPTSCCKRYGRANIPFKPVFYCSFFPQDSKAPIPRYITLLEISKLMTDTISVGIERATCSRWDIVKQLHLISLPFSDEYKRSIEDIDVIKEKWKKTIAEANVDKEALELVNY